MLLYLYIVKQTKTYTHYEITKHYPGNYFSSLFINLSFCSRYWEYERLKTLIMEFTKVNRDVNGNPRYVVHFSELLTEQESSDYSGDWVNNRYKIALTRAKKIGGKKFHNKQFGGGIVFQSYNIKDTEKRILELLK